jgi:chromosomal replication initiator protein
MTLPIVEGHDEATSPEATPAERVCAAILTRAGQELQEASFKLWFAELAPGQTRDGVVELVAPNSYVRNWLAGHHMKLIGACVHQVLGPRFTVRLVAASRRRQQAANAAHDSGAAGLPEEHSAPHAAHEQPTLEEALDSTSRFPSRYTFDSFVPGPSNKFAHAAAMAVAESPPSTVYNPMFVYGGVGLGKTHLLFAVGNLVTTLSPRTRARYVTSESFMTEFIKAVRERRGYQFQRQYRDVDVLLLDDVQFLARAEETQTEFFHTFNHLHQHERQIVIASDRPPQELGGIEERLRSRFRSGLVVDIQPPDLETRIAILQMKALRDHLAVTDDVLHFIASRFESNIRELEGALLRVNAFGSITRQQVDLALAERALEDLIPASGQEIRPPTIMQETATYFGLTEQDLVSKSRSRQLTTARHVAMYLMREFTGLSLIRIGELFDRDHTTALHGIKKIEALMSARGSTYRQVQELTKVIRIPTRGHV